jgi:mannose-6-phosphate isomerase-like protein (cupin superfamily)
LRESSAAGRTAFEFRSFVEPITQETQMSTEIIGEAKVLGPDEGRSFWQPVPANGFIRNLFNDETIKSVNKFSIGTQTVAPRSFIREHTHDRNEEIIFVVEGKGIARVDGVDHPIEKGSCLFIGHHRKHHFLNPNDEPLTFLWLFLPGGLDNFFEQIGRPRTPGEPAPEPFPRPENVEEIERRTVFGWADNSYNAKK